MFVYNAGMNSPQVKMIIIAFIDERGWRVIPHQCDAKTKNSVFYPANRQSQRQTVLLLCSASDKDLYHKYRYLTTIMPESKNGLAKKSHRSHSFGGCDTCRRRHVKCDQIRPTCLTCKAVGVECAGYRTDLEWVTTSNASSTNLGTSPAARRLSSRRHLYSGNGLPASARCLR